MNPLARLASVAAFLAAAPALAADPLPPRSVQLDYTRAPGSGHCPAEQVFRDVMEAKQLRFKPFVPIAPARLVVKLARAGVKYQGHAELHDEAGTPWFLDAANRDCFTLIEVLAVQIVVKLDVEPPPADPKAATTPPTAPPPLAPERPPVLPPPPPRPEQVQLQLGLGGALSLGAVPPNVAFDLVADLGVRGAIFSGMLEGRWSPPLTTTDRDTGAKVSTHRLAVALLPCAHWRRFHLFGCGIAQLGVIQGEGTEIESPRSFSGIHVAAGGRVGVELHLWGPLTARFSGDLLGTIRGAVISLDSINPYRPTWTSPPVSGGLGAGVDAFF